MAMRTRSGADFFGYIGGVPKKPKVRGGWIRELREKSIGWLKAGNGLAGSYCRGGSLNSVTFENG